MRYLEQMRRVRKEADGLLTKAGMAMACGEVRDNDEDEASDFARAILAVCDEYGV